MATEATPDLRVLADLDWSYTPPCDVDGCEAEATHKVAIIRCGCSALMCWPHAEHHVKNRELPARKWHCTHCGVDLGRVRACDLIRVTPLPKGGAV